MPVGNVAILQMRDIDSEAGVNWAQALRISPPGKRKPDYLLPGDVIFTSRGARNLAVAVMDVPDQAICAPNLFVIRMAQKGVCLPEYLAWFINQRPAQDYFLRSATGTNILNIRREVIEQLKVFVPSLHQQEIITKFDAAARLERELLQELIKNRNDQMEALALSLAGCAEA